MATLTITNVDFQGVDIYAPPFDQYWSNVVFLGNFDSGYTDSSQYARVPSSVGGGASINNSVYQFGSGSLNMSGSNSRVSYPDTPTLAIGTQPFTLEGWMRISSNPGTTSAIISQANQYQFNFSNTSFVFSLDNLGRVSFTLCVGNTSQSAAVTSTSIALNSWVPFAICRGGDTFDIYLNGIRAASQNFLDSDSVNNSPGPLQFGGDGADGYQGEFAGLLDEVRFTIGVRRYNGASYTVATEPFPPNG